MNSERLRYMRGRVQRGDEERWFYHRVTWTQPEDRDHKTGVSSNTSSLRADQWHALWLAFYIQALLAGVHSSPCRFLCCLILILILLDRPHLFASVQESLNFCDIIRPNRPDASVTSITQSGGLRPCSSRHGRLCSEQRLSYNSNSVFSYQLGRHYSYGSCGESRS